MKSKAEIVLRALLQGYEVEIDNSVYRLFRAGDTVQQPDGDYESTADQIMMRLSVYDSASAKASESHQWAGVDMPLASFVTWAEAMSDEAVASLAADLTLKNQAEGRVRRRTAATPPATESAEADTPTFGSPQF